MDNQKKDRKIKWLILLIPTLTIGLWEYVRHVFLLPYLTMELGNLLAPFIVLAVTLTLVRGLFARLEQSQHALQQEKSTNAALEERESLARELHDGLSQSLFLVAVKLDQLEELEKDGQVKELAIGLKETVRVMHEDVRLAIANLREPPSPAISAWVAPLRELLEETAKGIEAHSEFNWNLSEASLSDKEKIELHACLREALINVRKHARATQVIVTGKIDESGNYSCTVEDNGIGYTGDPLRSPGKFGLRMVRDRAHAIGWYFQAECRGNRTVVEIRKQGGNKR